MPLHSFTSNLPILSHGLESETLLVFSQFYSFHFFLLLSGIDDIVIILMDFSGSSLSDLLHGILLIAQAGDNSVMLCFFFFISFILPLW